MKINKTLIKKLKNYLKENSSAELASKLGYKSNSVIYNWIKRNSIPNYVAPTLKDILEGNK